MMLPGKNQTIKPYLLVDFVEGECTEAPSDGLRNLTQSSSDTSDYVCICRLKSNEDPSIWRTHIQYTSTL